MKVRVDKGMTEDTCVEQAVVVFDAEAVVVGYVLVEVEVVVEIEVVEEEAVAGGSMEVGGGIEMLGNEWGAVLLRAVSPGEVIEYSTQKRDEAGFRQLT